MNVYDTIFDAVDSYMVNAVTANYVDDSFGHEFGTQKCGHWDVDFTSPCLFDIASWEGVAIDEWIRDTLIDGRAVDGTDVELEFRMCTMQSRNSGSWRVVVHVAEATR